MSSKALAAEEASATESSPPTTPMVDQLRAVLAQGRVVDGESQETAGFRQAEAIMGIINDAAPVDE